MFLRPLYRRPVTDTVTDESIIFITWAFYITIKDKIPSIPKSLNSLIFNYCIVPKIILLQPVRDREKIYV